MGNFDLGDYVTTTEITEAGWHFVEEVFGNRIYEKGNMRLEYADGKIVRLGSKFN